jgi:hypothetical protein
VIAMIAYGGQPAREADFQAAWYYSLLLFVVLMLAAGGFFLARSAVRPMWRSGDRGPALAVIAAASVAMLFLLSMLVTVAVAMLPEAAGGG